MKDKKPLIRRTFSQERFEILIKKQQNGEANFNDLTELDEIVNRDPSIRYIVLEEMSSDNDTRDEHPAKEIIVAKDIHPLHFWEKIKAFISHFLNFNAVLAQLA